MIEVIRKGYLKRIECTGCGSLLEYNEREDIKTVQIKNELGEFFRDVIVCPECGKELVTNRHFYRDEI